MSRGRWLVVGLLLTAIPTLEAAPAHACTCLGATVPEHFAQADVVFVGELEANRPTPGAVRHRFDVDRVSKGEVGTVTDVLSMGAGGCGLSADAGQSFVVFATRGGTLWSGREVRPDVLMDVSCFGSRPMGVERAEVLFDTGHPPSAEIAVPDDSHSPSSNP